MVNTWYQTTTKGEQVSQGDMLDEFPVLQLDNDRFFKEPQSIDEFLKSKEVPSKIQLVNVVVLTQSCETDKNHDPSPSPKLPIVLCPRVDASEAEFGAGKKMNLSKWDSLVKNRVDDMLLLNKCDIPGYESDYQVVDFNHIFTMPLFFVEKFIEEMLIDRVTLISPYKEHLAQGFARKFSKIALPEVIKAEYPY